MPANKTNNHKAILKRQLLAITGSLKKSQRQKRSSSSAKIKMLKSVTHLRKSLPVIKKKLGKSSILLLIDPVRALEDIGYTLTLKVKRHVLSAGISVPRDRTLYDKVKKGTRKIKGISRVRISLK